MEITLPSSRSSKMPIFLKKFFPRPSIFFSAVIGTTFRRMVFSMPKKITTGKTFPNNVFSIIILNINPDKPKLGRVWSFSWFSSFATTVNG